MRIWTLFLAALILAACSKPADTAARGAPAAAVAADASSPVAAPAPVAAVPVANPPDAAANPKPPPSADKAIVPTDGPMLAYSYDEGVEAPASSIRALLAKHKRACAAAGPAVCQVTGSAVDARGSDSVHATLTLRAAPAWLARFGDALGDDATAAGGRLVRANVASEDLSRQIVDTEALIRAKTALRDRLQTLLETHPGNLSDLLEVETALSDAQDKLDATQSELVVMRERVATSVMTVDYRSTGGTASAVWWFLLLAVIGGSGLLILNAVLPRRGTKPKT